MIFSLILADNWVYLVFPLLLCVSLSVLDVRIFIVSLMMILIAVPMAMAIVYFNYMLTKSMVWSVSEKTIVQADDGSLVLNFENPKIHSVSIEKSALIQAFSHHGYMLINAENRRYSYLVLPEAAFAAVCE